MKELTPQSLVIHDTAPIVDGASVRDTLSRSIDLARLADEIGYGRYWTAETHGMRAVASCSPEVICAAAAGTTQRVRIGAAGVLLPNHSPLLVSERFGTLEAIYPDRIDLAVGRSLGGPRTAADAIRNDRDNSVPGAARQIDALTGYFRNEYHDGVRSVTGYGYEPQLWILGTSTSSAALAAERGLPYAFGGHLNYNDLDDGIAAYHNAAGHTPGRKYLAVSVSVIAADTRAEAEHLAESHRMKVMQRRVHQRRIYLPSPDVAARARPTDPALLREYEGATTGFVIGAGSEVRQALISLQERTEADELIVSTPVFEHEARMRSYRLVAGCS
ncbi:MsnO8 family LLM class oxidoreductase [Pseudonocardia parietis]|uniref:Luciferase family oxidoreductase group 1 n=1 Tax=Pseudonocardia parietis TaxID=570936 RepID=A0ABS4W6X5_9PSEU|nr:MsnO8 family LLM class oxidoreductase [Pseudonocardia parietis]MBP2371962.1 luciferase family oxidoreductase group 1 [Pseudonocardia parietis]